MNWIDFTIMIVLTLFALDGLNRNFILEVIDFLSFSLAFVLSLRFYDLPAGFFQSAFQVSHSIATVLGFATVWFLTELIFFSFVHLMFYSSEIFHHRRLKLLNKFSVIPACFKGVVFVAILLVLIGTFPIQPKIKQPVFNSKIGSLVLSKAQSLEAPLKNVFGGLSQDTLTFLTVKPEGEESVNLGFKTRDYKENPQMEAAMINLVNNERQSRGIKKLIPVEKLKNIANLHSQDMFNRGYFSHYSPEGKNVADRALENEISYLVIGENLAYAPSLELAHTGLMNSPGHKANILSADFNKIGIGIMDGGAYGLMITQVFSN